MTVLPRAGRVRAAFAALLATVLTTASLVAGVVPANAEGASAVSTVNATSAGLTLSVSAAGLGEIPGAYVALIPQGGEAAVTDTSGFIAMEYVRPVVEGALATSLTAPAAKLDRTVAYEVIVWQQHTMPNASNIYARSLVNVSSGQWDTVFPPVTPEPGPTPDPTTAPVPTVVVSVPTVSATAGATVRIVGGDFGATTGAYAAIIEKGTEGAVGPDGGYAAFGFWMTPGAIAGGAFDKTLVVPNDQLAANKTYEFIIWQGHAAPNASTIYARGDVVFSDAQRATLFPAPAPTVTVSKTTGINPAGETVTVTGTGFLPSAPATSGTRPPLAGKFTGTYIAFGSFLDAWQPSLDAASTARKTFDTKWAVLAADMAAIGGVDKGAIALSPDGSFTTTLTLTKKDAEALAGGKWGVYTYPGGGAKYAPFETFTPITFAGTTTPPTPTPTPEPPVTPGLEGGSLRWGFSAPFANYITGTIAKGSITVAQGATRAGGAFQFGQAAGSTYNPDTAVGNVGYTGTVRYLGHGGLLDVSFSNPELRISTPGSAALYVTHGGARIHLANVALASGTTTRSGNTVTVSGAPTTLAAGGVSALQGNYAAGSALEPLTVVIGAPAAAPAGATGTVSAAPTPAALRAIPAAPPASTGIELDQASRDALEAGGEVTLTASGFGANEQDIAAVVYSTPTVLARNLTADASGVVQWTGSMPASLANGEHTFTLQGSVSRGVVFELARDTAVTLGSCEVSGATLSWGFMTSFRNYIEGVGGGGWELSGVEYQYPNYVWANGTGTVDVKAGTGLIAYGGSIRFTGHHGALDSTLANARIELAGERGYIVVDVIGTTQAGETVNAEAVRFAEFKVPADALDEDAAAIVLTDLPTTLTAAGAAAFGTYPEGEVLDTVSATIPVDASCVTPVEAEKPVAAAGGSEAVVSEGADPAPVWPWAVGGIALLLIAAAAWIVVARRKAAATEAAE